MNWSNWATVADLCTALGTLILAVATFSAVRSANLTARVAQQSLLVGLRPVLMASRQEDPTQKVNFGDDKWVRIPGGGAVGEVGDRDGTPGPDDPVYLAVALRNAGSGIAVLHGWHFYPGWYREDAHAPLDEFRWQTRDLYIPVGDIGFWQGAFREPGDPRYSSARKVIEDHQPWTVELLYGDHEGGQRCVTRFTMFPPATWPCTLTRRPTCGGSRPRAGTGTSTGLTRDKPRKPGPRLRPRCDFGDLASGDFRGKVAYSRALSDHRE